VLKRDEGIKGAWTDLRDDVLAQWQREQPGTRPWGWWCFDAPEPERRRVGGTGEILGTPDLEFGIPRLWSFTQPWHVEYYNGRSIQPKDRCHWNQDCVEGYFTKAAHDPVDPPRYESQAQFLHRHGLLTDVERRHLRPEAFGPEPVPLAREHDS
jgi:hypothetical protein